jgi:hypothetical protein
LYTLAISEEVLLTGAFALLGAGLGAAGAVWAGKKAADETARAEATRQKFARDEQAATRRAAARVVELQLTQTLQRFESAMEKHWLPVAFDIPSWDDIRTISPALSKEDWSALAEAMRWLRYIRTLAATVAGTSDAKVSAGESEMVPTEKIESGIREALPPLEAAVVLVKRQAGEMSTGVERTQAGLAS